MYFYISQVDSIEHLIIFIFLISSLCLSIIILFLSLLLATHNPYYEKVSAYECGFEPFEDARNKFDIKFYIVALLFLVFDVEVLYVLPWVLQFNFVGFLGFWFMIFFLFLLGLGFVYEIVKGALDW